MTPLDLTEAPPRPPRAALDGLIFLPRSIDKVRATLPGGKLGVYAIPGFTAWMLDMLGVPLDDFVKAVTEAESDDDVAAFMRSRVAPEKYGEWNAFAVKREPRNGNRAEALEAYPWLRDRPDLIVAVDILEEDDRQMFAR
jgi:hypothetical protein